MFFQKKRKKEVKLLCEPREGKKKAALDRVFPRVGPSKFQVQGYKSWRKARGILEFLGRRPWLETIE